MKTFKSKLINVYGIMTAFHGNKKIFLMYNPLFMGKPGYILSLRKGIIIEGVDDV